MGFFDRFKSQPKEEKRDLTFIDDWYTQVTTNTTSATPLNVVGIPAVYGAVNIISTNIAKLDLNVWISAKDGSKALAPNHAIGKVMKLRPNRFMSSFDFKRLIVSHLLLWGNAYIHITFDDRGNVKELFPLDPSATALIRDYDKGSLHYQTVIPLTNETIALQEYEILHLKNYSRDGLIGLSPISIASDLLGTQLGIINFSKSFYDNGTVTPHIIKHPDFLNAQAKSNIRGAWSNANSGLSNAHKIAILDGGLDITSIGMSLTDAEFIQTNKFNIYQISSIFNIPPFMIGADGGYKYNNLEMAMISFVRETLSPILTMIEQEFAYKLLKPSEQARFSLSFDASELLAGDSKTRAEYYQVMSSIGAMTVDEIRVKEGMNPLPKEDTLPKEDKPPQPNATPTDTGGEDDGTKTATN